MNCVLKFCDLSWLNAYINARLGELELEGRNLKMIPQLMEHTQAITKEGTEAMKSEHSTRMNGAIAVKLSLLGR